MTALFELAAEFRALSDKLNDSELDAQTIADTLDGASGDLEEKIINTAKYARNEEVEADAIASAIKDMLAREKTKRGRVVAIKKYISENMEKAGLKSVASPWFVVGIKNNPESVIVDNGFEVPESFLRIIPEHHEPDKPAIKQAIKSGFTVPGCHLERTTRIEIK